MAPVSKPPCKVALPSTEIQWRFQHFEKGTIYDQLLFSHQYKELTT